MINPWAHFSIRGSHLDDVVTQVQDQSLLRGSDITGLCKLSLLDPSVETEAIRIATGLDISTDQLLDVVDRTFIRGYANERRRGFELDDYSLPAEAHEPVDHSTVPQFNTEEFFEEYRERVMETLDQRATAAGLL